MSVTPRPPIPSFIPESAPFTPEQRLWLNGLFAGGGGRRYRRRVLRRGAAGAAAEHHHLHRDFAEIAAVSETLTPPVDFSERGATLHQSLQGKAFCAARRRTAGQRLPRTRCTLR